MRFPGLEGLSESERDRLWDAFQVPLYEVLTGFDGSCLACECEAGALHAAGTALFEQAGGRLWFTSLEDVRHPSIRLETGLEGGLDDSPCDCGRPGTRLVWNLAAATDSVSNAAD